jgi:hypothetical protein
MNKSNYELLLERRLQHIGMEYRNIQLHGTNNPNFHYSYEQYKAKRMEEFNYIDKKNHRDKGWF